MEYIKRGDALRAVIEAAMERDDYLTNPCIGALTKVPNADVVEVVRCKDCEYREKDDAGRYFCWLGDFYVGDTDYCSRGRYGAKMNGKDDD